ncbi:hypothetical protein JX265_005957 [Neoarthrinium moseri]|uniref:Uncharacterized protein n=1 Tax=Neoarthrinium moseri TaxID=1658444 RepID=A0A9P9WMN6_9PEZI|nr:hypothetical protein JX265_005957 [Neoarthrinium moseri]
MGERVSRAVGKHEGQRSPRGPSETPKSTPRNSTCKGRWLQPWTRGLRERPSLQALPAVQLSAKVGGRPSLAWRPGGGCALSDLQRPDTKADKRAGERPPLLPPILPVHSQPAWAICSQPSRDLGRHAANQSQRRPQSSRVTPDGLIHKPNITSGRRVVEMAVALFRGAFSRWHQHSNAALARRPYVPGSPPVLGLPGGWQQSRWQASKTSLHHGYITARMISNRGRNPSCVLP